MLRVLAAFIFFTRLPFGKNTKVSSDCFKHVVTFWPVVGWFTAGISVAFLLLFSLILPLKVAVLLAICSRLFITGCLHEDGLADFFDGFGGGINRERILEIMKDSKIGAYGVIALVCYFLLYYNLLVELPMNILIPVMLVADPFCKGLAGMVINCLPYARKENESKSRMVYERMNKKEYLCCGITTFLPFLWLPSGYYLLTIVFPVSIFLFLINLMKRRINGYTGDCCGSIFLLCELSFYIGVHIVNHFIVE